MEMFDAIIEHPRVQSWISDVGRKFDDRVSQIFDQAEPLYRGRSSGFQSEWPPPKTPPAGRRRGKKPPGAGRRPGNGHGDQEGSNGSEDPRLVMGFSPGQKLTEPLIKRRKRELAAIFHPDRKSGCTESMSRVNRAAEQLLGKLRSGRS